MMADMDKKLGSKILVLLSMVYGGTIALLAAFGSGAMLPVAMIGAMVLGVCWVAVGMFGKDDVEPGERRS